MITILICCGLNSKGSQVDNGHVIDKRCGLRQGPEAGESTYPLSRRARIHSGFQQKLQLQPCFELSALREIFLCRKGDM